MADRTVNVRLNLDVSQFRRGAQQAEQDTRRLSQQAQRGAAETQQAVNRAAASQEQAAARAATAQQRAAERARLAAVQSAEAQARAAERAAERGQIAQGRAAERMAASQRAAAAGASRVAAAQQAAAERQAAAQERAAARAAAAQSTAMGRARASVNSWASQAQARAGAVARSMVASAERSAVAWRGVRNASLLLVGAMGAAVYAAAKFDKAMSNVAAVSGASASEMQGLRQAALEAGKATQYSASQSADAEAELARAGVSVADITGGALKGSLAMAAAGQMDLADSATLAAQAMNTFHLQGRDVTHIADVLASAANKTAADMHGLGMSLRMGGLLAEQTGLSLEDTVGVLGAFADRALIGSDAGTSLKVMLQRLVPQSQEAADMMQKLGFSAYDSKGQFVGLQELAERMKKSFSGLTPEARNAAMATIFGADAVRSATIMYQLGGDGIKRYVSEVNDQGAASRMAARQTDNLSGDLERLKGALEVALIQSGTAANGVLRGMAQWVTKVVNAYSSLPPELQTTATLFGGVAGVVGLAGAGMMLMLPRIMAVRRELVALGVTAARTRTAMMGLGKVGLITAGIAAVSWGVEELVKKMDPAPANVSKLTSSLLDLARGGKASGEAARVLGTNLDGFGEAVARVAHPSVNERLTDISWTVTHFGGDIHQLTEAHDKLSSVDQALATMVSSGNAKDASDLFAKLAKTANDNGTSTEKLRTLLPQYDEALSATATQAKLAAGGQQKLGDATQTTTDDLKDQRTEVEKLQAALDALNGKNIDVAKSAISFQGSLGDLKQAVKENGHSLDITTEKGRAVKSAFLAAAEAAQAHAQAVADQQNSVAAGNAVLAQDVEQLKRAAVAAGLHKDQVDLLARSYAQLPPSKTTTITDPGAQRTIKDMETVRDKVANIPPGKSITVKSLTKDAEDNLRAIGFKVTHLRNGQVRVTLPTNDAFNAAAAIEARIRNIPDGYVTVHVRQDGTVHFPGSKAVGGYADGGVLPGYAPRRDSLLAMLSPGEGVLVPEAVRALGGAKAISALNRWGRHGVMPHFADGGTVGGGFSYTPTAPASTFGAGSGMDRYTAAVQRLKDAWDKLTSALANQRTQAQQLSKAEAHAAQVRKDGNRKISQAEDNLARVRHGKHTHAQLIAAEKRLSDARYAAAKANKAASASVAKERADKKAADKAVSSARGNVVAADKALGLKAGAKTPTGFDLKGYQLQLAEAAKANAAWEKNLQSIGARAGSDVEETLRGMGEEGQALVAALAHATGKQFDDIVKNLKALAPTAKATLSDFTSQLQKATGTSKTFQDNLLKLAQMGYGDLAAQLAAQGDETAAAVAAAAVKDSGAAAKANSAAKAGAGLMSGEDVANAIRVIGALKGRAGVDFAQLVMSTGLDVSTLLTLLPKIRPQIDALPDANRSALLAQWSQLGLPAPSAAGPGFSGPALVSTNRVRPMARGGLLSGRTPVLAAEAGPEAWIPLDGSARSRALLGATAGLSGYQLVPAGRFAGPSGGGQPVTTHVDQSKTVVLNGARQTAAEQAADILRHMTVLA